MATLQSTGLATFGRPADAQYVSIARLSDNPTVPTSVSATLGNQYKSAGLVTEDGITQSLDLGKDDPLKDWNLKSIISPEANPTSTLEIRLMSQTADALGIVYGGANVTGADNSGVSYSFDGPTDGFVVVIDELWNAADGTPTRAHRLVYPSVSLKEIGDIDHTKSGAIIYDCTFEALVDESGKYFYGYIAAAAPAQSGNTEG